MSKSNRRKNSGIRAFTAPPSTKTTAESVKPVKAVVPAASLCPKSTHIGVDKEMHVDDFLDQTPMWFEEKTYLNYVHFVLEHFRKPAVVKMSHDPYMRPFRLFVTYEDKRYRVTGASRLGDVFLANDLKRENGTGYDLRVGLNFAKLTEWSDQP